MLTLEEAIKHCEEKAEELKKQATTMTLIHEEDWEHCIDCMKEHEQLAEWLKELKVRRERDIWLREILDSDEDEVL